MLAGVLDERLDALLAGWRLSCAMSATRKH
jgi:hypothetical protein